MERDANHPPEDYGVAGEAEAGPREVYLPPTPRRGAGEPVRVDASGELVGEPVPAAPEHRCSKCDYLLTGLTSRRCPECGECFTLSGARAYGLLTAPEAQRDAVAMRMVWLRTIVGVVALCVMLTSPWALLSSSFSALVVCLGTGFTAASFAYVAVRAAEPGDRVWLWAAGGGVVAFAFFMCCA